MDCPNCGKNNRQDAAFCDSCGSKLGLTKPAGDKRLFIGREQELEDLNEAIRAAKAGRGSIAILAGSPGIGKTKLTEVLADQASENGFAVVWGRCSEDTGAPPYWPWMQMVRRWLDQMDDDAFRESLAGIESEIASLVDDVRMRLPQSPHTPQKDNDDVARFRFFDALSGFWRRVSRKNPVLLVFEDLHWADTPSLKLLEFFSQELTNEGIMVLGTYRDIAVTRSHPLSDTLGDLSRRSGFIRMNLAGLNLVETSQLMAMTCGKSLSSGFVTSLFEKTEGNPLFLGEMARYYRDVEPPVQSSQATDEDAKKLPLPDGIREIIGRRLNKLSDLCVQRLSVASVIGQHFDLPLVDMLMHEASHDQDHTWVDEAIQAHIIEQDDKPGLYHFAHALIRDTFYEEITSRERCLLHHQIGEALENRHGDHLDEVITSLAYHFTAALPEGDVDRAIGYAESAGHHADALLAFEEAVRYYRQALNTHNENHLSNPELSFKLNVCKGDSLIKSGESIQALKAFRTAANLAKEFGSAHDFASAAISFEEASWRTGMPGHVAVGLLQTAVSILGPESSILKARVLASLSRALTFTGDLKDSREINAQAEAMAREINDPASLVFVIMAGLAARWGPERLTGRLAAAREAIEIAETIGDQKQLVDLAGWYMFDSMEAGDVSTALNAFERQDQLAHRLRQPYWLYIGMIFKSTLSLFFGNIEQAEKLAMSASQDGDQLTGQDVAGVFGLQMFNIRREQGRLGEVESVLGRFLKESPRESTWRPGLAMLYAELEKREEAKAEFDLLAQDGFAVVPKDALWPGCLAYLAEVCVYLGDVERAKTLHQYLLPHDGYNIVVGVLSACYGAAARFLGKLETLMEKWDEAEHHFQSAIRSETRQDARLWLAHSQYEYARMLLSRKKAGDVGKAHDLLSTVISSCEDTGMHALKQKAEAIHQTGKAGQSTGAGESILSPREVEVLQLISSGLSNRDIARLLSRSENTVANHVRHILEKTGTSNRAEAVAFAARTGLTGAS